MASSRARRFAATEARRDSWRRNSRVWDESAFSTSSSAVRTAFSYCRSACSCRASWTRMLALMRPPEKIGQRTTGSRFQNWLIPELKSATSSLRPPRQQFGGKRQRNLRRRERDCSRRLQLRSERARVFAEQDAEAVHSLLGEALQCRALSGVHSQETFGARRVQFCTEPRFEARIRQLQRVPLRPQGLLEDLELLLRSPQLRVVTGDVGQERDENVPPNLFRRLKLCQGSFLVPPHAAEDVDLPTGIESCLKGVLLPGAEGRSEEHT